jgi:catechol 2,3-dioxygenase-like lactoylglutathione lyase family enzyme
MTTIAPTKTIDFKLEVAIVPVSDIDRAKQFYGSLGWREDVDLPIRDDFRAVHFTPPGSPASILFGVGVSAAAPGSARNLLAVSDVEAARADLVARGIDVSGIFHGAPGFDVAELGRVDGVDPDRKSYGSWAQFQDPDGNTWLLQELTTRLPGR